MADGRQFDHKSVKNHPISRMNFDRAAYFELDERHVIKNNKVALDRLRVRQNVLVVTNDNDNDLDDTRI